MQCSAAYKSMVVGRYFDWSSETEVHKKRQYRTIVLRQNAQEASDASKQWHFAVLYAFRNSSRQHMNGYSGALRSVSQVLKKRLAINCHYSIS